MLSSLPLDRWLRVVSSLRVLVQQLGAVLSIAASLLACICSSRGKACVAGKLFQTGRGIENLLCLARGPS